MCQSHPRGNTSTAAHTPLIKTWLMACMVACGIIDEPNALNCLCVSPAYGSNFCVTQSISLSYLHKDSIPQASATAGLNPGVSKH